MMLDFQSLSQHVSIHLMPKRLALTLGGLIDEEVVMEFLFQHRGSAFAPCNHSNDDDDEFWDASGRYLTERKEDGILEKTAQLGILFQVSSMTAEFH